MMKLVATRANRPSCHILNSLSIFLVIGIRDILNRQQWFFFIISMKIRVIQENRPAHIYTLHRGRLRGLGNVSGPLLTYACINFSHF